MINNKIKEYRKYYGLSQRKLAKIAEISPSELRNIEGGKHDPGLHPAIRIARALKSNVYEIWEEEENEQSKKRNIKIN